MIGYGTERDERTTPDARCRRIRHDHGEEVADRRFNSLLFGAAAFTRVMQTLLFETSALDVPTFALVAAIMLLVALISSYLPTRRALRADPMIALRRE
jgi:hypothetical protein